MSGFIIMTDADSDLPLEYLEENHIPSLRQMYRVEQYLYGKEEMLNAHEFFNALRLEKQVELLKIEKEKLQQFLEHYAKKGKPVLFICFSKALGGCMAMLKSIKKQLHISYPNWKFEIFDTCSASLGEGLCVVKAAELRKQGKNIEEVCVQLEKLKQNIQCIFFVEELRYWYQQKKISKVSELASGAFQKKPVVYIDKDGKLQPLKKVKLRSNALVELVNQMELFFKEGIEEQLMIGIVHADCQREAERIATMIKARFGIEYVLIRPIGMKLGKILGPSSMGVVFLGETDKHPVLRKTLRNNLEK